jgi:hypothetical protein
MHIRTYVHTCNVAEVWCVVVLKECDQSGTPDPHSATLTMVLISVRCSQAILLLLLLI